MLAIADQAMALHRAGRFADAAVHYRQILALKSDLPVILNNLGHALAEMGSLDAAVETYRRSLALDRRNVETLCNLAVALAELGRLDQAEAKLRRAIAIKPDCAGAHNNLGQILKERGCFAEAARAMEKAIALAPSTTSYYENLGAVRRFNAADPYVAALEALAEQADRLGDKDRMHLNFALAKARENDGDCDGAFAQLSAGNRLKRKLIGYDEARELDRLRRTQSVFDADFISSRGGGGDASAVPIFIVGMPRSGTTLIEQILASHPQVFGAGELGFFEQAVDAVRGTLPGAPAFPELAPALAEEHFYALGRHYVDKLRERAPNAARITDKMPGNFIFAGLIQLALPRATIIHAVRDPLDTCVSCFGVHFTRGQPQTYDLAELGRYYRHYRSLMAHWRRVLPPGRIFEMRYEELVADTEAVTRRLLDHCGLAWDPRCLDFHRTERPVRTASAMQVRKPIYTSSIGRWRRYEKFLAPLQAELERSTVPTEGGDGCA